MIIGVILTNFISKAPVDAIENTSNPKTVINKSAVTLDVCWTMTPFPVCVTIVSDF